MIKLNMNWKEFSVTKITISIVGLIIGLILKFPAVLESLPPKYKILGLTFTQSQYSIINIIAIIILIVAIAYIVILLADKFKK